MKNGKTSRLPLIAAGFGILAFLCAAGYLVLLGGFGGKFSVEPSHATLTGKLYPDSAFTITLPEQMDGALLGDYLTLEPQTPYRLEQIAGRHAYRLTPQWPLTAGGTLSMTLSGPNLRAEVYRYTVKNIPMVGETFPQNGQKGLPVTAGIECSFNTDAISIEAFTSAFSIEPPVGGRFALEQGSYIFYPDDSGMQHSTSYTVTIDGALALPGTEQTLGADYQFTFTTESELAAEMGVRFRLPEGETLAANFMPDEPPTLGVRMDSVLVGDEERLDVNLYRYENADQFAAAMQQRRRGEQHLAPQPGMPLEDSFRAVPLPAAPGSGGERFLRFPNPLPQGWYLAELTATLEGERIERCVLLQSSELSVYALRQGEGMLVWVNDTVTGEPVSGAQFSAEGELSAEKDPKLTGRSGQDGVIVLNGVTNLAREVDEQAHAIFTVRTGGRSFVGDFPRGQDARAAHEQLAYTSFYTDRPTYRTSDTIEVWGVVRPRDHRQPLPDEPLTLSLRQGEQTLVQQPVTLAADGIFLATLPVENASAGEGTLALEIGDKLLREQTFFFGAPGPETLTVGLLADQPFYAAWRDPQAALTMQLRGEGNTPVSDYAATLWTGDTRVTDQPLHTDGAGLLHASLPLPEGEDTWRPQTLDYAFTGAEQAPLDAQGQLTYLARDVILRAEPQQSGTVMVRLNALDLTRATRRADLASTELLLGEPLEREITAELHRVRYEPIAQGTAVDPATGAEQASYRHEQIDELISANTYTTIGGSYLISDLPQSDHESSYYLLLATEDERGLAVKERLPLGETTLAAPPSAQHRYGWQADTSPDFADGETLAFTLCDNGQPIAPSGGRTLYTLAQETLSDTAVTNALTLQIPYHEELLPNYTLAGAYFDGKRVYPLAPETARYSPEKRALALTVTPDRELAAPGEELSVAVEVRGALTGQPVAQAVVLLAVTDASAFAAGDPPDDILRALYANADPDPLTEYTSFRQSVSADAAAPADDSRLSEPRAPSDSACFTAVRTDESGVARFAFPLPDRMVGWRMTAHAITDDLQAGSAVAQLETALPYLLQPSMNTRIVAGDSFTVSLRGQGSAVSPEAAASYTLEVSGGDQKQSRQATGINSVPTVLAVEDLPAGSYLATIEGTSGSYTDKVTLPFTVESSAVALPTATLLSLTEPPVLATSGPVELILFSAPQETYATTLAQVDSLAGGRRAEQRLAARYRAEQQREQGVAYDTKAASDTLRDLGSDAVLRQLSTDTTPDILLTAKAHLAMPQLFSAAHGELANLMPGAYQPLSAELLARALAGGQTSAELLTQIGREEFDFVDRMYLAVALQAAGDTPAAERTYRVQVPPRLGGANGISYIELDAGQGANAQATAAALMAASLLGMPEADGFAAYLNANPSRYDLFLLERMIYLNSVKPSGVPASLSYQQNGRTQTIDLGDSVRRLTLTAQEYAAAAFASEAGEVFAWASYQSAADTLLNPANQQLGITRTIEPVEGETLTQGALVQVTLTLNLDPLDPALGDMTLALAETIPAGLRFEPDEEESANVGWYLDRRDEQSLRFLTDGNGGRDGRLEQVRYRARCTLPGSFSAEPAYLSSRATGLWGKSEPQTLTIE